MISSLLRLLEEVYQLNPDSYHHFHWKFYAKGRYQPFFNSSVGPFGPLATSRRSKLRTCATNRSSSRSATALASGCKLTRACDVKAPSFRASHGRSQSKSFVAIHRISKRADQS